ncbi:MAG: hypothetical protein ACRERV_17395, partial [Methylococcales bacterium]
MKIRNPKSEIFMKRLLPLIIIVTVLAGALGAFWFMSRPGMDAPAATSNTPNASPTASVARVADEGAEPPHSIGPAEAPVTLEEFGDFECPPCGLLHPVLKTMEHEFGPRLRIIF